MLARIVAASQTHFNSSYVRSVDRLPCVMSAHADGVAENGQSTTTEATVTMGGASAMVSFSGLAPGFVALYQVNAEVPAGLGAGNQPVVVKLAGTSSNSVLLPVE
jgi:uncharacterized protein (TIGR03437 family)